MFLSMASVCINTDLNPCIIVHYPEIAEMSHVEQCGSSCSEHRFEHSLVVNWSCFDTMVGGNIYG